MSRRDPRVAHVRGAAAARGAHDLQVAPEAITPAQDPFDGVISRAVVDDDQLPVAAEVCAASAAASCSSITAPVSQAGMTTVAIVTRMWLRLGLRCRAAPVHFPGDRQAATK